MQSLPSYNPADTTSVEGALNIFGKHLMQLIEQSIPAIVESYDASTNQITVRPAINVSLTTGEFLRRDVIKVTAWIFGAGGFFMRPPYKKGDTGWLIASDNDTSLFKQGKKIADANTNQKHRYSFGYFIPDKINGFSVSADDNNRFVIQNDSGTERISIGANDTKIFSTNLSIQAANVNITGTTSITGDVSITGKTSVSSDLTVGGKADITGTMHSSNYDAHTHTGNLGSPTSPPDQ